MCIWINYYYLLLLLYFSREISAIASLCLFVSLFVFRRWSPIICGFCFYCGTNLNLKNKIAGSERYLQLFSRAVKLKSTSVSLKTQSHSNKKGREEKGNLFPEGVPCMPRAVRIHIFFFIILLCALLALLTQHESMRVTQRSSGVEMCCCGTWAQVQHQQLYQYVFLHLRPLQHHFKDGLFLGSLLKQVGLDTLLPHLQKVSFIFIYQKYCCASALFFMF